ncbi:MAG: CoA transferase [Gordonia sp. (in: high G+C Gram-positive bacteria)]
MTVEEWARSGLADLTGYPDAAPDLSRARVLDRASATLARFIALVTTAVPAAVARGFESCDVADFLSGRAGLVGLRRGGRVSAGGATRLVNAADGILALSLARDADRELVPALLWRDGPAAGVVGADVRSGDVWAAVEAAAPAWRAADLVARARLLGLPAALLGEARPRLAVCRPRGARRERPAYAGLLVADLSALWAGPLCGQLLHRAGATVVKVESPHRPDGTRAGNRDFFDWMNGGKLSYRTEFDNSSGGLRELLETADVVIEASRPRALARLGLAADQLSAPAGQVWVRITAHGSDPESADWVGFGDDAAVAGGLVAHTARGPVFCGDALADPLTGLEAARAVAEAIADGGGVEIDIALSGVAAAYAADGVVEAPEVAPPVSAPRVPLIGAHAHDLGADNVVVNRLVAQRLRR